MPLPSASPRLPYFQGYAACPIKALYLRPSRLLGHLAVAEELKRIGAREGFDVFIQVGDRLYQDPDQVPRKGLNFMVNTENRNPWNQDAQVFVRKATGEAVKLLSRIPRHSTAFIGDLARALRRYPEEKTPLDVEGGNLFLNRTLQGTTTALVGQNTVARFYPAVWPEDTRKRLPSGLANVFRERIGPMLEIDPRQVQVISQPDFHLDLAIRPLGHPRVLLQDPALSLKLIEKAMRATRSEKQRSDLDVLRKETIAQQTKAARKYASADHTETQLKTYGYDVISVPGVFGCDNGQGGLANFLNAVVHENARGELVYITGASHIPALNRAFEKALKKTAPEVTACHFITGGKSEYRPNRHFIQDCLNNGGGLHCLVSEEPDFARWDASLAKRREAMEDTFPVAAE